MGRAALSGVRMRRKAGWEKCEREIRVEAILRGAELRRSEPQRRRAGASRDGRLPAGAKVGMAEVVEPRVAS